MSTSWDAGFPFRTSLSLEGPIRFWADAARRPESPWAPLAAQILQRLDDAPELRGPAVDPAAALRHPDLLRQLLLAAFPAQEHGTLGAAAEPFRFEPIFVTPEAQRLGVFSQDVLFNRSYYEPDLIRRGQLMTAYEFVLGQVYGLDPRFKPALVVTVQDPDTRLERHFQMAWDNCFLEVVPDGPPPLLTLEALETLLGDPLDLDGWIRLLPPERFEFRGLGVSQALDVTWPEASSRLKEALLARYALTPGAGLEEPQTHIRTLLREPDLEIGLIGLDRGVGMDRMDTAVPVGRSLLLAEGRAPDCPHRDASTYAATLSSREVRVFRDLGSCGHRTRYEAGLLERGIRSLALLPLFVDDRMVGLLELGSPKAGAVDAYRALQLKSVLPAFAIALQRALDEREDRLQAIIKRRYTAIHPAVEWRFRNAALKLLDAGSEEDPELDAIVFPDVYPLYGLTDIRNSSDARQVCARTDLTTQIRLARAVVDGAGRDRPLPVLRELAHRLDRLEERVGEGTLVEDEDEVVRFLGSEVEPLMDRLSAANGALAAAVAAYRAALDPQLGVVYGARREFEASVARFNEAICAVIDREQLSAQEAFPHYFERFKTDGVDYNVYVGDSLSPDGGFTRLYLQNLRLWQLQLACRIEWELQRLRPQLPMDLPATHLILAQDQPLTIRFRVDEKRFDVDGAYNTHELVKKRIDKVRTRSGERLTQPGTVAIVYSHAHEGQLYRRHLEYLTADGFLQGDVEQLALEDVQGVPGLKGMRVAIAPEPAGGGVQDALTPGTPDRGA